MESMKTKGENNNSSASNSSVVQPRIPRPPNAFMLYANGNRKRVAQLYPKESNKEISKRLGSIWKALDDVEKKKYYDLANAVVAEHKRKYPDYVYNPKEARIRKAMREASRERIGTGTTPIPPPRSGRRVQPWASTTPEEQLMMTPSGDMNSPMCNSTVFPGVPGSQFHHTANYTKFVHVLPPNGWMNEFPSYLQHNPIAELQQHQANMWHQYQEPIRHCSSGTSYMMQSQLNMYHEEARMQKKADMAQSFEHFAPSPTDHHHPATRSTSSTSERMPPKEEPLPNGKRMLNEPPSVPISIPQQDHPAPDSYYSSYQGANDFRNSFDKPTEVPESRKFETPPSKRSPKAVKPLPDFNEAFGSTERGRFQSPPDPRLTTLNTKDPADYFLLNDEIRFDDYQS